MCYADDGIVGSQGPKQLQDANHNLCDLFCNCISLKPTTKRKLKLWNAILVQSRQEHLSSAGYNASTKVPVSSTTYRSTVDNPNPKDIAW